MDYIIHPKPPIECPLLCSRVLYEFVIIPSKFLSRQPFVCGICHASNQLSRVKAFGMKGGAFMRGSRFHAPWSETGSRSLCNWFTWECWIKQVNFDKLVTNSCRVNLVVALSDPLKEIWKGIKVIIKHRRRNEDTYESHIHLKP